MISLVELVRSRFLDLIRSVNPPGRWKILVVDDHTQRLLGATLKQYDILQENVTSIENISNNRAQNSLEAMYILMPTTQNARRIVNDFSEGKKQYGAAHLFFIDPLPDRLDQMITESPAAPHLKTLRDIFPSFWPTEAQIFSVQSPGSFYHCFSPLSNSNVAKVRKARFDEDLYLTARKIFNVCVTLGENPYIRYYVPSHHQPLGALSPPPMPKDVESQVPSRWRTNLARGQGFRDYNELEGQFLCRILAGMVQEELDEFAKSNPEFGKPKDGRPRGTLVITDRSMDTVAPFLHEFTYQAMCNDLLKIDGGTKYSYKFQSAMGEFEDKTETLSDADTTWTTVRHMHMREAIDKLMHDFNTFLQENAGFKGDGAATLNDMKDMLANLPQYKEQREKFSLHLNIAQACMDLFEKEQLPKAAKVEQELATGLTAEGKSPKSVVEEMVPLLDSRDVSNASKARIIALYIQHREGVPDEDRRRLYQHARLPVNDQDAINSLAHLGVRVSRQAGDRDGKKKLKPRKEAGDEEYELSRYKPLLQTVLQDLAADKLDNTIFPYVKDSPSDSTLKAAAPVQQPATSLRSAKPSWHRAARPSATSDVRQRVIVFVAGGMTYSEARTAYLQSNALNRDVYIGSTHLITPQQFLEDLRALELGGLGSRYMPKGIDISGPETPRPFQQVYDSKYYTKDPPPPPQPAPVPAQPAERERGGRRDRGRDRGADRERENINMAAPKEPQRDLGNAYGNSSYDDTGLPPQAPTRKDGVANNPRVLTKNPKDGGLKSAMNYLSLEDNEKRKADKKKFFRF